MASNTNNQEGKPMTSERFSQLARAGLPFNPLTDTEITGANLVRLQRASQMFKWDDPRFVDADQAKAMGWTISENAFRVQLQVRDGSNGAIKIVGLYNACFVGGMPALDSFLAMSGDRLAAIPSAEVTENQSIKADPEYDVDVGDDEEFSISPARIVELLAPATAAQSAASKVHLTHTERGIDSLTTTVREIPAVALRSVAEIPGVLLDKTNEADRFAVTAPYWRDGLHNAEGLALASEINKSIAERALAEDREAIERLLSVHEKAQKLGLSVVPEDLHRNDPSLRANPAQPRTLLGGALVRDDKGAYRPAAGGRAVLQDNGDKVSLKAKTAEGYQAAMELAIAKGWTAIELKGKPEMLADAWLEAKHKGLDVVNYSPTKKDIEKYTARLAVEKARPQPATLLETTPELVEVRPFVDAQGDAKTATVVYSMSQTDAEDTLFESARDAAKAFGAAPASTHPMVIRTVTHVDGNARTDVVAAVGDSMNGAHAAVQTVLDEEFELAMLDEIADSKAATLSLGPKGEATTRHIGQILEVQGDQLVQSIGRGKTMLHDIASLDGPLPKIGEVADIRYENGVGRLHKPEPQKDRGTAR